MATALSLAGPDATAILLADSAVPPATEAAAAPLRAEFTDRAGRVWAFALDPAIVAHVRDVLGIDFERMAHDPAGVGAFVQLLVQPGRLREALWLLCAPAVAARGLTAADFLDVLDGFADVYPAGAAAFGPDMIARGGAALAVAVVHRWPASPLAAVMRMTFEPRGST
jgi:hypothetical protein